MSTLGSPDKVFYKDEDKVMNIVIMTNDVRVKI